MAQSKTWMRVSGGYILFSCLCMAILAAVNWSDSGGAQRDIRLWLGLILMCAISVGLILPRKWGLAGLALLVLALAYGVFDRVTATHSDAPRELSTLNSPKTCLKEMICQLKG